jgi:hypothetical protein
MAGDAVTVELKNFGKLRATIERKFGGLVKGPAASALRSVGEVWMTEAKKRTPVDTGVLRSTGHVQGPMEDGDTFTVRLVFGGPAAPYAVEVHENLRASHKVGQSKFLESVTAERGRNLSREVAAMMIGGAKVHGAMFNSEE